ncbi:hypothetical protein L596_018245 [Steinernema carpocapsae]|uniref:Protein kinase domain-containing protein n=1 Tax=Steinernema carpocapsae TaxID=34508 RepID=A0A4U5N4I8_STECR|nr:hypothetical protein L596_018245 [Steinernema carpocapsae]
MWSTDAEEKSFELDDSGFYSAYELKEVLGRGLASTVRRCVEKGSGKTFAAKIVDVSTERQSEKEAERLLQEMVSEVKLLKLLSAHPSIITLHDFHQTPTFLFAVFEILTKHFVYMENILCIDDERIVISDFGFATELLPGQRLRELFGTPGYLAPLHAPAEEPEAPETIHRPRGDPQEALPRPRDSPRGRGVGVRGLRPLGEPRRPRPRHALREPPATQVQET